MGQVVRYQEILRRLAIIDDGFVEDPAGLGLGLGGARVLDPRTAALVQVAALAAIGSPAVCLEWSSARALAAGATEDEITDVLLAIAPVAGLGRVVTAVSGVADAFGYDIEAALEELDGHGYRGRLEMSAFDELVASPGVIMAGRFAQDGRVAEHKTTGLYLENPAGTGMAQWFCAAITAMFGSMAYAVGLVDQSGFNETSWLPMRSWTYTDGD
jgi:alkylhydroperoxidase/carboxymuconolactone decarboxylase family protein YurZ/roadblock/LC7 domain-containing protein